MTGFGAIADVQGHLYLCDLWSRRGRAVTKFTILAEEIAHSIRAYRAVIDGEIVCLNAEGKANFYDLLFRRRWPHFVVFDLLSFEGRDYGSARFSNASACSRRSCQELTRA